MDISINQMESQFSLESTIYGLLITLPPLFATALAVIKKSFMGPAWIIIGVGSYFQYIFHTTHDPSKLMIMLIPWFVYWVIGFYAFLSLFKNES